MLTDLRVSAIIIIVKGKGKRRVDSHKIKRVTPKKKNTDVAKIFQNPLTNKKSYAIIYV